jgi:HEAT repeat protein
VLLAGLTHDDYRVRRQSARLLIERREASAAVLTIAMAQDDVVTARQVGMAALDQALDPDVVLDALWGSSIPSLRAAALYRFQSVGAPSGRSASDKALFDRSPSVRFLAQRYLAKHGVDVPQRYRDALGTTPAALHGLAEIGVVDDAEAIQPYLDDASASVRSAAVHAVGRLLDAGSRPLMLAKLDDPNPAVVRAACRVLERQQLDSSTLDQLWEWATGTTLGSPRRAAFAVFFKQSRWPKLLVACRSIASNDEELRSQGELLLRSALDSWNRSSTRPTAAQLDELTTLEPVVRGHIDLVADLLKHAR